MDTSNLVLNIAEKTKEIQEKEHRSVTDIMLRVPSDILEDRMRLLRFLTAWANLGRPPYEVAGAM